jgi:hypothetical protein
MGTGVTKTWSGLRTTRDDSSFISANAGCLARAGVWYVVQPTVGGDAGGCGASGASGFMVWSAGFCCFKFPL